MSISNWDIFSKDSYGESTKGVYYPSGPHKPRVEIYKNWLYLYTGDLLVGSLEEGKATFCGVDIYATRGPQDGVYVIVQDSIRPWVVGKPCAQCGEAVNSLHIDCEHDFETQYVAWVGCGVYGYSDDDQFIGVTQESLEYLRSIMDSDTIYNFSSEVRDIDLTGTRFNQGDAYLANAMGYQTPDTEVGKAEPTIMSSILSDGTE